MGIQAKPFEFTRRYIDDLGTVRKFPHLPKYGHARLGEGGGVDLARF